MAANKLRKMLGSAESSYIVSPMRLIETQSKATIAKWCLDCADASVLSIFETRRPGDDRGGYPALVTLSPPIGSVSSA